MKTIEVVFTDQAGPIVNRALTLRWTHVLVKFGDMYYEATWPKVQRTKTYKSVASVTERLEVTDDQYTAMELYAWSKLGLKYNFWGYFFPRAYGRTRGIYCSQYACNILRAGGVNIPKGAGWSPDKLLKAMKVYT